MDFVSALKHTLPISGNYFLKLKEQDIAYFPLSVSHCVQNVETTLFC